MPRTPHSGDVRICVGPAAPEVIPSPSDPMSCSRKSEKGWNVWFARNPFRLALIAASPPVVFGMNAAGFDEVVTCLQWQPPQPIWLKSV